MNFEILLITATITPYCEIPYNDVQKRKKEYEDNLEKYIKESNFKKIIFAENSGNMFPVDKYVTMAHALNKEFEYLDVSSTAEKCNMSMGDAKIINDAIKKSKLIEDAKCIWKVSGRIWIDNINKILESTKGRECVFLYAPKYDSIQTWFFKIDIAILKRYFLTKQVFERMNESCIEYCWKESWEENKNRITLRSFPVYPDAKGVNSSGNLYSVKKGKLLLRNILLKFGYYTVKSKRRSSEKNTRNSL